DQVEAAGRETVDRTGEKTGDDHLREEEPFGLGHGCATIPRISVTRPEVKGDAVEDLRLFFIKRVAEPRNEMELGGRDAGHDLVRKLARREDVGLTDDHER